MSSFSHTNIPHNIPFYGIKKELQLGEKILRSLSREFPEGLVSNTKLRIRILNHQNDPKFQPVIKKARMMEDLYSEIICEMRETKRQDYDTFEEHIEQLKTHVKQHKAANCGECALLVRSELNKLGIKSKNYILEVVNKSPYSPTNYGNHVFTVFNIPQNATENPKTWGNKAIIVDFWANIVMKAQNAIEYYQNIFGFKPQQHIIEYTPSTYESEIAYRIRNRKLNKKG